MLMASPSLMAGDQESTSSRTQWGTMQVTHTLPVRALLEADEVLQTLWEVITTAPQPTVEAQDPNNHFPLGILCLTVLGFVRAPAVTT